MLVLVLAVSTLVSTSKSKAKAYCRIRIGDLNLPVLDIKSLVLGVPHSTVPLTNRIQVICLYYGVDRILLFSL